MNPKDKGAPKFRPPRTIINRVVTVSFLIFVLVTCPVFGQANNKRVLTTADYHLWGTLYPGKLSERGNWVSFHMDYDDHPDTLFVKSTDGKREYKFAGTDTGVFFNEKRFATRMPNGSLHVLNLESGKTTIVNNVEDYCFSSDAKYRITFEKQGSESSIVIRNAQGEMVKRINNVQQFKPDGIGRVLLYTTRKQEVDQLLLLSLDKLSDVVLAESKKGAFGKLVWQEKGEALAYLEYADKTPKITRQLGYYNLKEKTVRTFNPETNHDFPAGKIIGADYSSQLSVSHDGLKVFFGIVDQNPSKAFSKDTVQIWNGNDTKIFPQRNMTLDYTIMPKIAVWKPLENQFFPLACDERPLVFLEGKQDFAITYHPAGVSKEFQLEPLVDMYITDLRSGKTNLWLKGQSQRLSEISMAPNGRFAAYLKGGQWFLYDFIAAAHHQITNPSMGDFVSPLEAGGDKAYGIAGWGKDGKSLLFYDQYNIWSYTMKTKKTKRLTNGEANHCEYRVSGFSKPYVQNFDGLTDNEIDTNKDIIAMGATESESSYYRITRTGKQSTITTGKCRARDMISAADGAVHAFITERYDRPPNLYVVSQNAPSPIQIFESNKCHDKFYWGRNEVIHYKNSQGEPLSGILYYPAQYEASKKYPMLVNIYEEQLYQLHAYRNPTLNSELGFSGNHYLSNGYFVFLPDIKYRLGDPGISAADCVIAGTKKVLERGEVNPAKVGLIGHSFGGYETYFIITQTNIFAAAVAGAGVSDMRSFYLSVGLMGTPDFFRSENQQWRIGKSIFEDSAAYERNSPINFATNVTTPLLHWTGDQDATIDSYQAVGFYLALRRLNKTQQFLVYPNDQHSLMRTPFQKDLSIRIFEWFNHYLKSQPPTQWILNGTQ